MHMSCFTEYRRGHSYTCPLCMRSMDDMKGMYCSSSSWRLLSRPVSQPVLSPTVCPLLQIISPCLMLPCVCNPCQLHICAQKAIYIVKTVGKPDKCSITLLVWSVQIVVATIREKWGELTAPMSCIRAVPNIDAFLLILIIPSHIWSDWSLELQW